MHLADGSARVLCDLFSGARTNEGRGNEQARVIRENKRRESFGLGQGEKIEGQNHAIADAEGKSEGICGCAQEKRGVKKIGQRRGCTEARRFAQEKEISGHDREIQIGEEKIDSEKGNRKKNHGQSRRG